MGCQWHHMFSTRSLWHLAEEYPTLSVDYISIFLHHLINYLCPFYYSQEPVHREDDIVKFCDESGLPVALDETIDGLKGDLMNELQKFVHPGIVALVSKT